MSDRESNAGSRPVWIELDLELPMPASRYCSRITDGFCRDNLDLQQNCQGYGVERRTGPAGVERLRYDLTRPT
jgi:hypothetical protein